jgi:hypothetical protein
LNKLGRHQLEEVSCETSRSSSLGFLKEDFFKFFFTHIVKNNDTPWAGPVLTPGLLFEQFL